MRVGLSHCHRQKTLIETILVWELVSFGPAQSSTVSKVTMGCNMCVVQKPEEQYRVMFQVSALSPRSSLFLCLPCFHFFLTVFKQKQSFVCPPLSFYFFYCTFNFSYSDDGWQSEQPWWKCHASVCSKRQKFTEAHRSFNHKRFALLNSW